MSVSTVVEKECSRISFSQKRHSYGITLEDISKKSGLSMGTVSAYEHFNGKYTETRTRDENAVLIERALDDIIKERLAKTFKNSIKVEEKKSMEESVKNVTAVNIDKELDRKKIGEKIKKYCFDSGISLNEFCKMCDITNNTFSDTVAKQHPYLYDRTISKICRATGWTRDQLIGEKSLSTHSPKIEKPNIEAVSKTVEIKESGDTIKDKKLTYENGNYYMEYTVIRRVKMNITKEEFLKEIQKEEN